MDTITLKTVLKNCWTQETSSDPQEWSPSNPAWGQCATTALIVQDNLGGDILWTEAILPDGRRISHYFNFLSDEEIGEIDLTREQFPEGTIVTQGIPKTKGFSTTRDYILSYESTKIRYRRLKRELSRRMKRLSV